MMESLYGTVDRLVGHMEETRPVTSRADVTDFPQGKSDQGLGQKYRKVESRMHSSRFTTVSDPRRHNLRGRSEVAQAVRKPR